LSSLFSVDTVLFRVLGYPLSPIEFTGTICYLWSVWLIGRRNMLTWPVGIVSVLLYLAIFYQIRLYSDAFEQAYYLGASAYGWWFWSRARSQAGPLTPVACSTKRAMLAWALVTLLLSAALGLVTSRLHLIAPRLFPEPASYPWLDALTTVMSLTAMWLMARRHTESWIYWIVVDVIGIWLYYEKGVRFIALLYVVLLVLAVRGLLQWKRK
jgi:nicotinamide mononucleotide transporter